VREELIEQQAIGEYLYRTFRATVNTIRFVRRVEEVGGKRETIKPELVEIAKDELENARAARKTYEIAPWLSHKLRLDVGINDSLVMIDEKIRLLEGYVTS
jgi:retron-type reverse transcriptase